MMSNNSNSNHQNNRRYRLPSEDLESIDLSNDNLLTTPLKNNNSNNKNKVKKRSTIHLARKAYEKCTCTQLLCFFCSCTGLCIGLTLLFFGQSFGRFSSTFESHTGPIYYYLIILPFLIYRGYL